MDDAGHEPRPRSSEAGQRPECQAIAEIAGKDEPGIGQGHRLAEEPPVNERLGDLGDGLLESDGVDPSRLVGRPRRDPSQVRGVGSLAHQLECHQVPRQADEEPDSRSLRRAGILGGHRQPTAS